MSATLPVLSAPGSAAITGDEHFPFSLLTYPAARQGRVVAAMRASGEVIGRGTLTIEGGRARLADAPVSAPIAAHEAALERMLSLTDGVDGAYPITWLGGHRAPVEVDAGGLLLDCGAIKGSAELALALAWAAALHAARAGSATAALQRAAAIYRSLSEEDQATIQEALADGALDAGSLCALFLQREARETTPEEQERWAHWFLGQRQVDLPYDRKAVIEVVESDMDPDEKRLRLHEVVSDFNYDLERENIKRIVSRVRARGEALIFGRMSRAFHNQSLLFANATYAQVDDAIRARADALTAACAGAAVVAPAADRLRTLVSGVSETPMRGALGALECVEEAILRDQRAAVDRILKADREGGGAACGPRRGEVMARADRLLDMCHDLREALQGGARRPAAYVILSQRFFPAESYLFARINELQEPYLGKPENLKALVRKGGDRMYSSPDYSWLQHADCWVEAIPLFIKERVLVVEGVEVTETVIDQAAMEESFREQFADHWAVNIENVMASEHAALAREALARADGRLAGDDRARAAAVAEHGLGREVGRLAALIANAYRRSAEEIHRRAERDGVGRFEALRAWLNDRAPGGPADYEQALEGLTHDEAQLAAEAERLAEIAGQPRRPLPALCVLTTQSARMTDTYVCTWLEESMAMYNLIRARGLEQEVKDRMVAYRRLITEVGAGLIRELGMWAEVEELMARDGLPEQVAVFRVIAGNAVIAHQLAISAVLGEHFGLLPGQEAPLVEELLAARAEQAQRAALRAVYDRNDLELLPALDAYRAEHPEASEYEAIRALILGKEDYSDDVVTFTRFAAREEAVAELDRRDPGLKLAGRVGEWLRNHSRLPLTTARRETLLAHGLNHLTLHPLYYYRATGGNKRFHLLYTPSRVDLGAHERESVERWAQWVGGADREAARAGRRLFSLINNNVKMFESLTEPEVLKTGENASMVSNFSYSNAMALLVNSMGRGDVEELGDQMNQRRDRLIRPGGEGYGGYCVPKDGLFLEFVLILTRATKLRQLGVPDYLHAGVVALGQRLLSRRGEFPGDLEWEAWAAALLSDRREIAQFFSTREGADGPAPVFQITRIARALTQLGRPELTDTFEVLSNLAARWGIHKIIVGAEHVNRFMPFYKTWLTYQAVADARRMNPDVSAKSDDFTVVLSAEYKPDTQDGRFSVGMRKFEIFAGAGEHLTYSLDVPGQDLAHLMFDGFDSLWRHRGDPRIAGRVNRLLRELQVSADDEAALARLRELFPGCKPPAEIRMVSPMGLTTSDLLHYTSDTALEHIAQQVRRRLENAGLAENEINANMQVYGPRLRAWTKLRDLPKEELDSLAARIGGDIHALQLSILGPAGSYEVALPGADVLDTGIPHTELVELLADPVKLRDLMMEGNPGCALAIVDGASGARRRALNRMAVMRWFAAGEAVNRQAIYRAVGVGAGTVEGWRREMRAERERARALYAALVAGHVDDARERYTAIVEELRDGQETALRLEDEERMMRLGGETPQEAAIGRALAAVAAGLPVEKLDVGAWLALGGQFWTIGMQAARFAEVRRALEAAIAALGGERATADEEIVAALHCPAYVPAPEEFREEKGIESSNKATEEVAAVAIDTRKRLAERAARAKALSERKRAFQQVMDRYADEEPTVEALVAEARQARGDGSTMSQIIYGRLQAFTRLALVALGRELLVDEPEHLKLLTSHLEMALHGEILDPFYCRPIVGGYEDIGDLARLAQVPAEAFRRGEIEEAERDRQLARIADVAELFDNCKAVGLTIDFFWLEPPPSAVWRALADFFAESLNDHFYEYRPWAYSRGIGFSHVEGEALYRLAVDHHRWLYRFLRSVALTYTELGAFAAEDLDQLLGDMETADARPPIGCGAESALERQWRAYNQLRELAFIRSDGFPLPEVFPAFDPEIISAEQRVNLFYMYPIGRTHISRAIMEGPALTTELIAEGKPGANLLVARDARPAALPEMRQPVLQAHDAQLYISREEYMAALMRHRGMSGRQAEAVTGDKVGPKGIRVAARFTRPVTVAIIFPFHGHPKYESGLLEDLGLPYSSQSLFHTWTTYDKAKYPEIFCPETGVELPGEIDWLAAHTAELGEEASRRAIEHGDAARSFPGLRAFAQQHRLIVVKDAAESGGRGQKSFSLRRSDATLDDAAIADAVDFIYQISLRNNVAIQEVIISSPEYWATEEFLRSFVDRQVQEWGAVVNRTRRPRTNIYGSHRLIFSSDDPASGTWHISHPITLNSRQLITNVGRGGTLEVFRPEHVRPEFREELWSKLVEAGRRAMSALARYGSVAAGRYKEETGREIGEDATGLSYAAPRYMMLDFLTQPVFAEEGTLVDLEPVYGPDGARSGARFILQRGEERITGMVKGWRVVLIEPNIGIGLWDRVAIREEAAARAAAAAEGREVDWSFVGRNARIVLRDLAKAGADYLRAIAK